MQTSEGFSVPVSRISVLELGIDAVHARGFDVDPPSPSEFYTFSYYSSPIVLADRSGIREWPAGVSLLLCPEDRRYMHARSEDLQNSWFHFDGEDAAAYLDKYAIPTNTVMDLGELHFLKPILEEVNEERSRRPLHWEDAVSDLTRRFLRELGYVIAEAERANTSTQRRAERLMRDIRMRVHSNLSHRWTVENMAALGDYNPTWFATAYKRHFGLSPIDDLLQARMKHADALLRHLPMTVSQVATNCGFANVEHFTRLYRKRMGCTPGQTRRHGVQI